MSESPGLSRGSKTAAVVVLVVFLQLLVIAVLGLGAISDDRRAGLREARQRADDEADASLEGNVGRMQKQLGEAMREAVAVQTPSDLKLLQSHSHGRLVDVIYRWDGTGSVRWFAEGLRLWLSLVDSQNLDIDADQEAQGTERDVKAYLEARESGILEEQVKRLKSLVQHNPLLQRPGDGYLMGIGWAREWVEVTSQALNQEKVGPTTLRQAVLGALETEAMNRGRTLAVDWSRDASALQQSVDDAVACLADPDELAFAVQSFRRTRELLDTLRPTLQVLVTRYRALSGDAAAPPPRLLQASGELFVVAAPEPFLPGGPLVLARLDSEEGRQLAADYVDTENLARQGLRLDVRRSDVELRAGPLRVRDLLREGVLEVPYRAVLYRVTPPALPSGGPTEAFYLGIIGLAALGLTVGGVVLFRLWSREVRLARLKADFVSNLSHELKTPLTSISLFTEMLQEGKLTTEEERAEGLSILAQESQRLQRIVGRMIDVARREARGTAYDLAPGDLNSPVREAAERFRRIVTEPGLDLQVALAPHPLWVLMDAAAMDDAVTNLLSNAWKYKRGDRVRIVLRTQRRRGRAEITVSDDGIGIPRHERKRVFEMFYRAENYLTRTVAGTGLGLALVRTIVRAHRGRIRLEAGEGGVGSTFRLRLPFTRQPVALRPSASPASPASTLHPTSSSTSSTPAPSTT